MFVFPPCSTELKCKMKFAVYLPPKAETDKCPIMYWLSGESDIRASHSQQSGNERVNELVRKLIG